MNRRTLGAFVAVASSVTALVAVPAYSGETVRVLRTQVSFDTGVDAGEGWVTFNPHDPNQVVLDWLATSNASTAAGGTSDASPANLLRGYCGVARSDNGGRSFSVKQLPFAAETTTVGDTGVGPTPGPHSGNRNFPICGDPVMGIAPDGTIYAAAAMILSPEFEQSLTSYDGGWTWTNNAEVFGPQQSAASSQSTEEAKRFAIGPGRAWMAVDPITGTVSINSQEDGGVEGRWLVVSKDHGKSWSTPRPLDPDVQSSTAGAHAAAGGVIGVAYVADPTSPSYNPDTISCKAACTVFETTKNDGKTWSRHVVPGGTSDWSYVAADPTHRGRFALLLGRGGNGSFNASPRLELWMTADSGRTWKRTKVVATQTGTLMKAAIQYSSTGALGWVWRWQHPDTSYDVLAMVSRDGGYSFSNAIHLTDGAAPPNTGMSDDCACNVAIDDSTMAVVWGDARTGKRQLWFARFNYTHLKMHR